MSVQRHGRHVERFGDLGQGRRLEAPVIGELNGGGDHGFDVGVGLSATRLPVRRQPPEAFQEGRNHIVAHALFLSSSSDSNSTCPYSLRGIVYVILSSA